MNNSLMLERQLQLSQLEAFIKQRYDLRRNTLRGVVEIKEKSQADISFSPLTKSRQASLKLTAIKEGLEFKDKDLKTLLESDLWPEYNAVTAFLTQTGKWDGKDRIEELAGRVHCDLPDWPHLFHCWFLSMVKTWMGGNSFMANCLVPVLIGPQGYRKSTFWRMMLPEPLRFAFHESLDLSQKVEVERSLHRFLLINLDEFDQLTPKRQAYLKNILQKSTDVHRKLFSEAIEEQHRFASFCGTSNQHDLLSDPSGSRRFVCVEVKDIIDVETPIDYNQLYAQAQKEILQGGRTYLTHEEELKLEKQNEPFKDRSEMMQTFLTYYDTPKEGEEGEFLTATQIINNLNMLAKAKFDTTKVKKFGRELHHWNVLSKHTMHGTVYFVHLRSGNNLKAV